MGWSVDAWYRSLVVQADRVSAEDNSNKNRGVNVIMRDWFRGIGKPVKQLSNVVTAVLVAVSMTTLSWAKESTEEHTTDPIDSNSPELGIIQASSHEELLDLLQEKHLVEDPASTSQEAEILNSEDSNENELSTEEVLEDSLEENLQTVDENKDGRLSQEEVLDAIEEDLERIEERNKKKVDESVDEIEKADVGNEED